MRSRTHARCAVRKLDGTIADTAARSSKRRDRRAERHRRISASGRRAPACGGRAPAPAQASRREAIRADDAVARDGARVLRDRACRSRNCSNRWPHRSCCCGPSPARDIAWNVAHCSPYLGVMLPYSPLHHLLMRECPFPLIATSGNRSDEPIAIANDEATTRLKDIADHFLMHDRPIVRACDDSVVRLTRGRAGILRRARGYAPLGIRVSRNVPPVLAVGGHLKNTVAIGVGQDVFLSQHIGDLETLEARHAFERAIDDLCRLYSFKPEAVVCDLHPDYASTRLGGAVGAADHSGAASSGARGGLRGREQCRGSLPRRLLGRHRIRARRRDLGRGILPRRRQSVRAHRAPAPVRICPAETPLSAKAGARPPACSSRPSARTPSTRRCAPCSNARSMLYPRPALDACLTRSPPLPASRNRTASKARQPCCSRMKSAHCGLKRRIL